MKLKNYSCQKDPKSCIVYRVYKKNVPIYFFYFSAHIKATEKAFRQAPWFLYGYIFLLSSYPAVHIQKKYIQTDRALCLITRHLIVTVSVQLYSTCTHTVIGAKQSGKEQEFWYEQ